MKTIDCIDKYLSHREDGKKYNCAQAAFLAANEAWGLDKAESEVLLRGFGGGMNVGIACGAVTGGIAAMGCKYTDMKLLREKVRLFINTVRQRGGSENCIPLKEKYATEELGCKPTIRFVMEILDEIHETEITIEE